MEAHLASIQPTQVKKITTSCEICSGLQDTQYCMEDPEQAFIEYASLHTDEAGEDDRDVMFIEIVSKDDNSCKEEPEVGEREIIRRKLDPRKNANGGVRNFTRRIKGMHVFVGNFTYVVDFMIIEDISSITDLRLSQVVLGKPFVEISNMTHDPLEGVVRFTNRNNEVAYKMPHKIEQYDSLSNLEKKHTKSVYLRNEEDKRRGVEYVMSKILGFCKECLELGPEYLTGMDDEGEVTYSAFRRHLEEIHVAWAHLDKKRTRLRTYTNISQRISTKKLETASQITRDAVTIHTKTASQDLNTASECTT
nr:protein kinase-like domain, concanavalin A-like lectin/glucanase domain protein [Tanacetum cinerariifolium]